MALERDLQDYLFENPQILFPNQVIKQKRREVYIEGRFIDLLFEVDGTQYIVELKRDTIRRETIGQIFEYYGLMRRSNKNGNFKMILVAPSIPDFRRIPLEEFGIRCVEVPHPAGLLPGRTELEQRFATERGRKRADALRSESLGVLSHIRFEDMLPPVSRQSLHIAQTLLRDGLPGVEKEFSEYEVVPVRMFSTNNPGILCFPDESIDIGPTRFVNGGAWWAFSFGHSEHMPKNDVPNISVNALPWGLDVAVNAELGPSQKVMLKKIASATTLFDRLVANHGNLQFQAWLKLEHQPRIYHWIPLVQEPQGSWQGDSILGLYRRSEIDFRTLRDKWIGWIKAQRKELTDRQADHMNRTNQKLNLALRLVHSFQKEDPLWNMPYNEQMMHIDGAYRKLKPLVQFFQ